jgi:hypothetical protein
MSNLILDFQTLCDTRVGYYRDETYFHFVFRHSQPHNPIPVENIQKISKEMNIFSAQDGQQNQLWCFFKVNENTNENNRLSQISIPNHLITCDSPQLSLNYNGQSLCAQFLFSDIESINHKVLYCLHPMIYFAKIQRTENEKENEEIGSLQITNILQVFPLKNS